MKKVSGVGLIRLFAVVLNAFMLISIFIFGSRLLLLELTEKRDREQVSAQVIETTKYLGITTYCLMGYTINDIEYRGELTPYFGTSEKVGDNISIYYKSDNPTDIFYKTGFLGIYILGVVPMTLTLLWFTPEIIIYIRSKE